MNLELENKAALVTGSSRGIGRAIAVALLEEGAKVCLCARGEANLETTRAELARLGQVVAVTADVTTPEGASHAVAQAIDAFGTLDLLINNVGGSRGAGAFDSVGAEKWREVVDGNLLSAAYVSRPAVDWMKDHGGGAIVHISSIYGREYSVSAPYVASKAGLIALGKEMAVDLARYGIRVNTVAPGSTFFPGGSWERRQKQDPEKVARMLEEEMPFHRFGRAEEVAHVVAFLCSNRASWVSGVCVPVDGAQGRAL